MLILGSQTKICKIFTTCLVNVLIRLCLQPKNLGNNWACHLGTCINWTCQEQYLQSTPDASTSSTVIFTRPAYIQKQCLLCVNFMFVMCFSYEPELHPGAHYRIPDLKASLKIFTTGSITVTGNKSIFSSSFGFWGS